MSEIEKLQQEIENVKKDIGFVRTSLEDYKRRYTRDTERVWEEYRRQKWELESKIEDSRQKMEYFENEIRWRKDKISELENKNQEHQNDYNDAAHEVDRMRYDDIPDNEQSYDFIQRRRDAELSERNLDLNNRDIRNYESEITDFNNRYYSTESDIGDLENRLLNLRQDRRDKQYQVKIYYADISSADRTRMKDLLNRLNELQKNLERACGNNDRTASQKDEDFSKYETYVDESFIAADEREDEKEEDKGEGFTQSDFANRPQEAYTPPPASQSEDISTYYKPAQNALKDFAQKNNQKFYEETGRLGYTATVGNTTYNYQNKNRVEITGKENNKKTIPSVDDFVAALQVEKNNGKTVINISKADSDEYRARLMIACQKVGLRTRGYTHIENVDALDEKTCEALEKMPSSEKNRELLARVRQRCPQTSKQREEQSRVIPNRLRGGREF